jgi:flagellar basal-body rod protein FlgB
LRGGRPGPGPGVGNGGKASPVRLPHRQEISAIRPRYRRSTTVALLGTLVARSSRKDVGGDMDPILGIHESALIFRSQRMDVLATNLANADTPNFKARDMEFADIMSGVGRDVTVRRTHARHIDVGTGALPADLKYRNPHQPAMDGNTVEADLELSRYAENAVGYQASLMFVNGRISTLRSALTGGRS